MADKPPLTLEDLARAEAAALKQREQMRVAYAEAQRKLVKEMPEKFFLLAKGIRDGVNRFNEIAFKESGPQGRLVKYEESVAVTTRDRNLGSDFNLEVRREPNSLGLVLRTMWRPNRPDAYIIEGHGKVGMTPGDEQFAIRIDGIGKADGEIQYRSTCNFQPIDTPLEELAERMVMVIVTGEVSRLWNTPPWLADTKSSKKT
jgi:hypothetical protein